ncbi:MULTISPECIES: cytochrome b N-terminal domain-containing protein [unclassified Minwuia]|jgi:ubiquinol-cytochrome c reductase cytochrome b subunit|uniref:cytochrome b n=1 Tax=unclassified Minwuia TaxID=2618799 RepID=UPI0024787374|nr:MULTISPECIES: cytochrome b N-terminal domain-containing protein [unclassified Minwuia]
MSFQTDNKLIKWFDDRLPLVSVMHHTFVQHPYPRNLNFAYQFGSILGVMLTLQIVTGIVLAMHYTAHTSMAFDSVEHIMRDVNYGWLLRYMHANGASMFFIAVYLHMFRGLYYGSYKAPREMIWMIGVVILLVMMATGFMGYVLPWGQMSFWGATVITNLFSALPVVGDPIVTWLWGGFAVDNPTLNRFFSLHYLLPFVIFGLVFLHLVALHQKGSTNPLGIEIKGPADYISFHPYFTVKDFFGFAAFGVLFAVFVFWFPNYLGHPDNYIPADPLVTPAHIVPEWYFLPFYAILRSVPDKLLGVLAMFAAIGVLFILPWLDRSRVRSAAFRPQYKWFFWIFALDCIVLGYAGSQPAEGPMLVVSQIATFYYFFHFIFLMPVLGWFERPKPLPTSISEAVLAGKASTSAGENA